MGDSQLDTNTAFEDGLEKSQSVLKAILASYKYRHYGIGWINKRRLRRIIEGFESMLTLDPLHEEALFGLGKTWQLLDQHEKSMTHFARLTKTYPDNALYWYELACVAVELGNWTMGIDCADKSLERAQNDLPLLQGYAGLMIVTEQDTKARQVVTRLLEMDGSNKHSQSLYTMLDRLQSDEIYRPDMFEMRNAWRVANYLSDEARYRLDMGGVNKE